MLGEWFRQMLRAEIERTTGRLSGVKLTEFAEGLSRVADAGISAADAEPSAKVPPDRVWLTEEARAQLANQMGVVGHADARAVLPPHRSIRPVVVRYYARVIGENESDTPCEFCKYHNHNLYLACAVHPTGRPGEDCPDWAANPPESH